MAGSDASAGRGGGILLELLVAMVVIGVAGAAVVALLLHSLRIQHRAELLGRAAPAVVELLHYPPPEPAGKRPVGDAVLRWELDESELHIRLEIPREGSEEGEVVGRWRLPRWEAGS
jgi:hypothetical protein